MKVEKNADDGGLVWFEVSEGNLKATWRHQGHCIFAICGSGQLELRR